MESTGVSWKPVWNHLERMASMTRSVRSALGFDHRTHFFGRDAFSWEADTDAYRCLGALCENLGHIHLIAMVTCCQPHRASWMRIRVEPSRSSRPGPYGSSKRQDISCLTASGSSV